MACPSCGGMTREQIAPGFWRCRTLLSSTTEMVGHEPGRPWQQKAEIHQSQRECRTEYHEGGAATAEVCRCGTFAIGRCSDCGVAICGDHSALRDGKRVCSDCTQKIDASRGEATYARFFAGMSSRQDREIQDLFSRTSDPQCPPEYQLMLSVVWFSVESYNSSFYGALLHELRNTPEHGRSWHRYSDWDGVAELKSRPNVLGSGTEKWRADFEARSFSAFRESAGSLLDTEIDGDELRAAFSRSGKPDSPIETWPWDSRRIGKYAFERRIERVDSPMDASNKLVLKERHKRRMGPSNLFFRIDGKGRHGWRKLRGDGAVIDIKTGEEVGLDPHHMRLLGEDLKLEPPTKHLK